MTEALRIVPNVLLDALTLLSRGNVSDRLYCQTYDYLNSCSIFLAFKRRCSITEAKSANFLSYFLSVKYFGILQSPQETILLEISAVLW
jgi:hypothetical protein